MDTTAATPDFETALAELTTLGLRATRVVTRMMEFDQAMADVAAAWLPEPGTTPASLDEAAAIGHSLDAAEAVMAHTVPRTESLSRAHDRLSRAVRRTVALRRRLQTGWPRAGKADDRPALVRRQVARGVADRIRQESDGEAAERLFDDLYERLDDPTLAEDLLTLPVEEVVRRICRDLGLAIAKLPALAAQSPEPGDPPAPIRHRRQSG